MLLSWTKNFIGKLLSCKSQGLHKTYKKNYVGTVLNLVKGQLFLTSIGAHVYTSVSDALRNITEKQRFVLLTHTYSREKEKRIQCIRCASLKYSESFYDYSKSFSVCSIKINFFLIYWNFLYRQGSYSFTWLVVSLVLFIYL